MVDLVKIRRKAKEQREREAAEAARRAEAEQTHTGDLSEESPIPSPAERLELFRRRILASATAADQSAMDDVSDGETDGARELLTFVIAGEEYALDIDSVIEIVTPTQITRVPNAGANITGIISLRGTIVTILDVRGRLGHRPGDLTLDTRIVVVRDSGGSAGFLVDRVLRVVEIRPEELEQQPAATMDERNEMIQGVFRRTGNLSIVLDVDRLLGGEKTADDADV